MAGGCGGGDEGSTGAAATQGTAPATQTQAQPAKPPPADAGGGGDSGQGQSGGSNKAQPSIPEEEAQTSDKSIQEYGSEVTGDEADAVTEAMGTFLAAMASRDFARVCAGLTVASRQQLQQFANAQSGPRGCSGMLARILIPAISAEAKKAINATISRVRVGDGNAFVLFRPDGGKLSYFVMKEEDGTWKAIGLSPGTPFVP